jgi:hypothetical protein
MGLAREAWTDERLDDLVRHMDEGFARLESRLDKEIGSVRREIGSVRGEIGSVRGEMRAGFERADRRLDKAMHELRVEMNVRFDAIDRRFDSLHRTMLFFYGSLVLALIGFLATLT